jgi:hypothetical protein
MSDYVVVSTVSGQFAEEQVRAFLEAQGIPTEVRGETLRSTHGLSLDSLGAAEILVPRQREEEARELLAAVDRGEFRLPEEAEGTERTGSHGETE